MKKSLLKVKTRGYGIWPSLGWIFLFVANNWFQLEQLINFPFFRSMTNKFSQVIIIVHHFFVFLCNIRFHELVVTALIDKLIIRVSSWAPNRYHFFITYDMWDIKLTDLEFDDYCLCSHQFPRYSHPFPFCILLSHNHSDCQSYKI